MNRSICNTVSPSLLLFSTQKFLYGNCKSGGLIRLGIPALYPISLKSVHKLVECLWLAVKQCVYLLDLLFNNRWNKLCFRLSFVLNTSMASFRYVRCLSPNITNAYGSNDNVAIESTSLHCAASSNRITSNLVWYLVRMNIHKTDKRNKVNRKKWFGCQSKFEHWTIGRIEILRIRQFQNLCSNNLCNSPKKNSRNYVLAQNVWFKYSDFKIDSPYWSIK